MGLSPPFDALRVHYPMWEKPVTGKILKTWPTMPQSGISVTMRLATSPISWTFYPIFGRRLAQIKNGGEWVSGLSRWIAALGKLQP